MLRVRNLKTNFYTYAGVVKALDGVNLEMWEGETLGLVGETGCGKSVTALSILRLIPQPPGKIEEGEVLFDVPEADAAQIDRLERGIRELLPRVFREGIEAHPEDLSPRRLRQILRAASERPDRLADAQTFRSLVTELLRIKQPHDLLSKSEEEMRAIRGNKIAMIFQEPMQALNPVFPIGDQIAENILLHRRSEAASTLVERMELEAERDAVANDLDRVDPHGQAAPVRLPSIPPSVRYGLLALAWFALSGAAAVLFAVHLHSWFFLQYALLGPGLSGSAAATGLAVSLASAYVAFGLAWFRPWRVPATVAAAVDIVAFLALAIPPAVPAFRGALALHIVFDLFFLYVLVRPGASEAFMRRRRPWGAALEAAGGDVGELSDVRDLVARSRLPKDTREDLVDRLDGFLERAKATLEPGSSLSGYFHPWLPRRVQVSVFRAVAKGRVPVVVRVLRRLPIARRIVDRPMYGEAVRESVRVLRQVKISDPERVARAYPYELSGGMQQRALIAIALSCHPRLLIADEPTTALDVTIQAQILELVKEMKAALGSSVLIITHDLGIIAEMCNRVCVMYAGHIVEDADVRAVFKAPLHPYTQGLMNAVPSHTVRRDRLEIIRGSVPNLIRPPPGCRFHPRCPAVMPTCGWSPDEVGEHLKEAFRATAAERAWPFDPDSISWRALGPTELRLAFPQGTNPVEAADWTRKAVDGARSHPAIGAITAVGAAAATADGDRHDHVIVRIREPRKPPSFVPEPNHAVACLLYEEGLAAPRAGGASSG